MLRRTAACAAAHHDRNRAVDGLVVQETGAIIQWLTRDCGVGHESHVQLGNELLRVTSQRQETAQAQPLGITLHENVHHPEDLLVTRIGDAPPAPPPDPLHQGVDQFRSEVAPRSAIHDHDVVARLAAARHEDVDFVRGKSPIAGVGPHVSAAGDAAALHVTGLESGRQFGNERRHNPLTPDADDVDIGFDRRVKFVNTHGGQIVC